MKSIIEQASSITKAIEKAWDQAGKPKEFSIKIFEHEERNFFGMTTKPAKVGIFFGDKPVIHEKSAVKPRPEIRECRPETRDPKLKTVANPQPVKNTPHTNQAKPAPRAEQIVRPTAASHVKSIEKSIKSTQPHTQNKPQALKTSDSISKEIVEDKTSFAPLSPKLQSASKVVEDRPRRTPAAWNDTMITTTHDWLKQTLSLMGMPSIDFNSEIAGKNLKLTFNKPLITDPMHEKQLFRSFAHLIMSSLRNQYKQEIKDLKVILIRPE